MHYWTKFASAAARVARSRTRPKLILPPSPSCTADRSRASTLATIGARPRGGPTHPERHRRRRLRESQGSSQSHLPLGSPLRVSPLRRARSALDTTVWPTSGPLTRPFTSGSAECHWHWQCQWTLRLRSDQITGRLRGTWGYKPKQLLSQVFSEHTHYCLSPIFMSAYGARARALRGSAPQRRRGHWRWRRRWKGRWHRCWP